MAGCSCLSGVVGWDVFRRIRRLNLWSRWTAACGPDEHGSGDVFVREEALDGFVLAERQFLRLV